MGIFLKKELRKISKQIKIITSADCIIGKVDFMETSKSIKDIANFFKKLPSVGSKGAFRMAYAMLNLPKSDLEEFNKVIEEAIEKVHRCPTCGLLIDEDKCFVCNNLSRDKKTILVVTDSKDVYSIESTDSYQGLYFVLKGTLSPANHRTPEAIGMNLLLNRVKEEKIKEVIAVTNNDLEGETTSFYIANMLKDFDCKVTKPARGLPSGAIIEYADPLTMEEAIRDRVPIGKD